VGLLFVDAKLGQQLNNGPRGDLKFTSQLINANPCHSADSYFAVYRPLLYTLLRCSPATFFL